MVQTELPLVAVGVVQEEDQAEVILVEVVEVVELQLPM
jgi:hypothetical protein